MQRNQSLDGLKYILIVLVVLGHFIEPSRYENQISEWLYSLIYSFHMPLFIWMSGYFYKHRDTAEEFRRSLPLLEVCLISHIGFALLGGGSLSLRSLLSFNYSPSWYLLSLFFWRMASSCLLKHFRLRTVFVCAVAIEVVSFILMDRHGGYLSLMRTLQFYPYFVTGYMMKGKMDSILRYKPIILLGGVISITFILLTSSRLQHQVAFQREGLVSLSSITEHGMISLWAFRYAYIVASLFVSAMVLTLAYGNDCVKRVARYGQGTLFVYFSQTLVYAVLMRYELSFCQSLTLAVLIVPLLTYLSTKDFSKWVMNPISSLIKINK